MLVSYFYCPYCGLESNQDIFLAHSGCYANGDFYYCPECNEETNDVLISGE